MTRVNPVLLDQIEGAKLTVPAGDPAAHLRDGLRGSVIERDLQSLCVREDGVDLLTGCALAADAMAALERAGLSPETLAQISGWAADEIAVHFIDDTKRHRMVWGPTRGRLTPSN